MSDTRTTIGPYVQGEIPAPLSYQFQSASGTALDLTGYSAVFVYRQPSGTTVNATATIPNPTDGRAEYVWDGTEMDETGLHRAELWVGNGTNRFCSLLLQYTVRAPVGAVPAI